MNSWSQSRADSWSPQNLNTKSFTIFAESAPIPSSGGGLCKLANSSPCQRCTQVATMLARTHESAGTTHPPTHPHTHAINTLNLQISAALLAWATQFARTGFFFFFFPFFVPPDPTRQSSSLARQPASQPAEIHSTSLFKLLVSSSWKRAVRLGRMEAGRLLQWHLQWACASV